MKTKMSFSKAISAGFIAGIASVVVNLIIFFACKAAGIITDDIHIQPDMPLTAVPIVIASLLPAIVGSIVFFLIEKYTQNGFRIFSIIAYILLALSMINPFVKIPNVTIAYAIALDVMHLPVALFLLYFINRAAQK